MTKSCKAIKLRQLQKGRFPDGHFGLEVSDETFYMFYCAVDKNGNRGIGLIRSKEF